MRVEVIQAEYDRLDDIAGRFAKHAESMVDMRLRIENGVQALQRDRWQGEGSVAFFTEMERDVFPAMTRLTGALEQAQSVTSQAKDILQAAEEEAKRPFQSAPPIHNSSNTTKDTTPSLSIASTLGNILKGVATNVILPQQYVFRSLSGGSTVAALMDMFAGKPGKGLPLIRFDGSHGGTPFPHINLNPKLTGFKDLHTPISPQLLKIAGKSARIFEGIQKIALPAAITIDLFRIGSAFHHDGNQIGHQTKQTVGSVAGGWGGAFLGAKAGAVGGAWFGGVVGSAFPVVGTAVGAGVGGFLGGLIGGIGGGLAGSELGEMFGGML